MNSPTVFLLWKRDKQSSSTCYLLTVPWSLAAQPYHSAREQRAREIKMNFLQIFIPHQSAICMTLEEFFLKAPASFSWQFIPSMSTVTVARGHFCILKKRKNGTSDRFVPIRWSKSCEKKNWWQSKRMTLTKIYCWKRDSKCHFYYLLHSYVHQKNILLIDICSENYQGQA